MGFRQAERPRHPFVFRLEIASYIGREKEFQGENQGQN
jgi:hypothetical protein